MRLGLVLAGGVLLVGIGVAVWQITMPSEQGEGEQYTQVRSESSSTTVSAGSLLWQQSETGWTASGQAPACPIQPMMEAPANLSLATAILYPGQVRGGNYKPHGGFRFDNSENDDIAVRAPLDGYVVRGSRYLELGEVQYAIDIMHNCGIMYRFDHLRVLSSALQAIADTWPEPSDGSSQTTMVNPPLVVAQGAVLATSVGFQQTNNASFDWGVYDFRNENEASQLAEYQAAHQQDRELSWHAVCWFDWLPSADAARVKGLPAGDPTSGTRSDYCK